MVGILNSLVSEYASVWQKLVSFLESCISAYRSSVILEVGYEIASQSFTLWYPRHKLQYRIGLFFGAATVAGECQQRSQVNCFTTVFATIRRVFWFIGFCHWIHGWYWRPGIVVMDIRQSCVGPWNCFTHVNSCRSWRVLSPSSLACSPYSVCPRLLSRAPTTYLAPCWCPWGQWSSTFPQQRSSSLLKKEPTPSGNWVGLHPFVQIGKV